MKPPRRKLRPLQSVEKPILPKRLMSRRYGQPASQKRPRTSGNANRGRPAKRRPLDAATTASPPLVDRSVKVARHLKRATIHDTVAAPMACRRPPVRRTRVVPILIVTNRSSAAVRTVLPRRKEMITKDARNRVQKPNSDVVRITRPQLMERIIWDVVTLLSLVAVRTISKPLLVLIAKVARRKPLPKHPKQKYMRQQRNLSHQKIVQTPPTVAVPTALPLRMARTLRDAVSLIPKIAARPISDAALTEFPQLSVRITMAVGCLATIALTDAARMG